MFYNKLEAYKIWAPDNALWTDWAKPTAFINMQTTLPEPLNIPDLGVEHPHGATAVIVDLPGKDGVLMGLSLARAGYRPVPLYNGVGYNDVYKMVVQTQEIEKALYDGAEELRLFDIAPDAPPVFLLDSNRMSGFANYGRYDNRWSVFPQDFPSAAYLISKGIKNVIVRTDMIRSDLEHVLYRYQTAGIGIYKADGQTREQITVSKPSKLKSMLYRFGVIFGLRRNPAGGFGGMVPEPGSGG